MKLLFKLRTLALKTLANVLNQQAAYHPRFRQFIIGIGQANHRTTIKLQRRIYGHATDVEIRPLNEEKAVQAAADFIVETFVLTVAGAALIFEVQRSARSKARKEERCKQEEKALRQRREELAKEVEQFKHKHQELEQLIWGRGLSGVLNFRPGNTENGKTVKDV